MARASAAAVQKSRATLPSSTDLCDVVCINARKVASARKHARPSELVQIVADTFRVLGDPTRLRIVDALSRHELCVCDLALTVSASQSTVSHSLRALRQMRLVRYRKEGKIAYYALNDATIAQLLSLVFQHAQER
jgi:DNA-binding transcriptional ArsR family regulator